MQTFGVIIVIIIAVLYLVKILVLDNKDDKIHRCSGCAFDCHTEDSTSSDSCDCDEKT